VKGCGIELESSRVRDNRNQFVDQWKSTFQKRFMTSQEPELDNMLNVASDIDVEREHTRVMMGEADWDLIVLKRVRKTFSTGVVAVDELTIGIPPGECFGLIGSNGAGKSTTMGLLTSEYPPTEGQATIAGFDVVRGSSKLRRRVGYCPQFDALFANLTSREHVELYAAIKGVPQDAIYGVCEMKLTEVNIPKEYWDKNCCTYSEGLKRRLSLACATIGQPQVILLDECSTGVDPVSRREIWQLVSRMVGRPGSVPEADRTSVILTTHSMEEAETLCSRIGIMVDGKLRCLGSAQHLKSKFGGGYFLELKAREVNNADGDYLAILNHLNSTDTCLVESGAKIDPEDTFYDLEQCKFLLNELSADLPDMITWSNKYGSVVWKDAVSASGVSISTIAAFATTELRVYRIERFIESTFENAVLRDRQDTLCSFEITNKNVKVASIFEKLERNKKKLMIQHYSVSQTSLEQVFNMHAAAAAAETVRRPLSEFVVTLMTTDEKKEVEEPIPSVISDHRLPKKTDIV
jgi:ATP-binding cassette, subfamily A (ABC1), member 3